MSVEQKDSTEQDPRYQRGITLPPRRPVSFQGMETMDVNLQWLPDSDSDESVAHEQESTSIRTDTSLSSTSSLGADSRGSGDNGAESREDVEEEHSDDGWEAIEDCLESIFRAWDNGRPLAGPEREILFLIRVYVEDGDVIE